MTSGGKRKPRYGFGDIVMPRNLPRRGRAANLTVPCSVRSEIVLEAFLGSGTTVIAAERTGWRCYGLELDPAYVDTVIRRWQAQTGGSARHAASGRSFDDLACEAEAADAA